MSENSILNTLKYDKNTGALTYKDIRYLLIRPETIHEFQVEMEKSLGVKTKEIFYKAGFKGGYLSAKKYKEVFNFSDRQIIDFMLEMGTEIGWGRFSLNDFNEEKGILKICVDNSPFILPGKKTEQSASYLVMGVIGGLASVIFDQHCPYSKVKYISQDLDKSMFIVDLDLTHFSILEGKRILAVDDEPDIVDSIEEILDGCIVDKAVDFETAKKRLQTQSYDAIILDIMGVNGYELLKIGKKKGLPVLMLTANALDSDHFTRTIKNGAQAYVPKESLFEINTLLADVLIHYQEGIPRNSKWFVKLDRYFNHKYGSNWKDRLDPDFWEKNFYN
ncbi:response regulator [Desulfobacula sp.]|uniref:response regulator n=1 Tax=Desulfobacula sp. TaxID=2593537 RepID=UPI00260DAD69|nr:response regulator [Desulfobacula sp.]